MYREKYPTAAPLIDTSMFMDDFVAGMEDGNGAVSLYYELTGLMKTIKLPTDKWATNSEELKEIWKAEGQDIRGMTQALGIDWYTEPDTLSVDSRDILDNMGLFSHVSAIRKTLYQETWCRGMQWEEILPHDIRARWYVWMTSLTLLPSINVLRWMGTSKVRSDSDPCFL
jgi:hypothetical protein